MRAMTYREGKWPRQRGFLIALLLALSICSPATAREALRVAELPRDFQAWAAWRADDASLAERAMGRPSPDLFHAADFCLGAMFDSAMAHGLFAGQPLHAMAYCPPGLAAMSGTGQPIAAIRIVSIDRPPPGVPVIAQNMCPQAIRNR